MAAAPPSSYSHSAVLTEHHRMMFGGCTQNPMPSKPVNGLLPPLTAYNTPDGMTDPREHKGSTFTYEDAEVSDSVKRSAWAHAMNDQKMFPATSHTYTKFIAQSKRNHDGLKTVYVDQIRVLDSVDSYTLWLPSPSDRKAVVARAVVPVL